MSLFQLRRKGAPIALLSFVTFFASMFPILPAQAEQGGALQGTGGPATLAASAPPASGTEALASVDPSTGSLQATLPFVIPQARGQAQPSLSLVYNSAAGVGFAGMGWTLDIPSIERRGASGLPRFIDEFGSDLGDRFYFAGSALVPICPVVSGGMCAGSGPGETFPPNLVGYMYFRTELDDGARYFFSSTHETWIVQLKTGVQLYFGLHPDGAGARSIETASDVLPLDDLTATTNNSDNGFRWNLVRQVDPSGNVVMYSWAPLQGGNSIHYLTDIFDTTAVSSDSLKGSDPGYAHHTHLRWSDPDDSVPAAAQSPLWRTAPSLYLLNVDVSSQTWKASGPRVRVRRYRLDYKWNFERTRPFLHQLTMEGHCGAYSEDASGVLAPRTGCAEAPSTTLDYEELSVHQGHLDGQLAATQPTSFANTAWNGVYLDNLVMIGDLEGDGLPKPIRNGQLFGGAPAVTMEPRASTDPRMAKVEDLVGAPGSPPLNAIQGDWVGDGRLNVVWANDKFNPNWPSPYGYGYELYSGVVDSSGGVHFKGLGPFELPRVQSHAIWPKAARREGQDVDGDGLTDIGFDWDGSQTPIRMRSYFTVRRATGEVVPFSQRSASTCVPAGMWDLPRASGGIGNRGVADTDGDGLADFINYERIDSRLIAHIYKNRGDGRVGLAAQGGEPCENNANVAESIEVMGGDADERQFKNPSIAMGDITGDGLADFVATTKDGIDVYVHSRTPSGTSVFTKGDHIALVALGYSTSPGSQPPSPFEIDNVSLNILDVDASGVPALVVLAGHSWGTQAYVFRYAGDRQPGVLISLSNGIGATTTIKYDSVAKLASDANKSPVTKWKTSLPRPARVVTTLTTTNGLPAPHSQKYVTDYAYADPIYDARDRQFYGFRQVTARQYGEQGSPGSVTRTTFATQTCSVAAAQPCPATRDYRPRMWRGVPAVVEQLEEDGKKHIVTTVREYGLQSVYFAYHTPQVFGDGRVVHRRWGAKTDVYLWGDQSSKSADIVVGADTNSDGVSSGGITLSIEIPNGQTSKKLEWRTELDWLGNDSASVEYGVVGVDTPIRMQRRWGVPQGEATQWAWRILHTDYGYADPTGQAFLGSVGSVDFSYEPRALLTSTSSVLTGTAALDRHRTGGSSVAPSPADASQENARVTPSVVSYGPFGNPTYVKMPNGRCALTRYDDAYAQLPKESVMFRGGCDVDPITTTRIYDRGFARVTHEFAPTLRHTTSVLDALGRVTQIYQPSDSVVGFTASSATVTIDYPDPSDGVSKMHTVQFAGFTDHAEAWQYVDGFGHPLFTLRQGDIDSPWIVEGAHTRTANGRVAQVFQPSSYTGSDPSAFPIAGSPLGTLYERREYDASGRLVAQRRPDNTFRAQFAYSPLVVQAMDAEQIPTNGGAHQASFSRVTRDGHGRTISTVQHYANDPQIDVTTQFAYAATGEATSVTATNGSQSIQRWMQYDSLGRMVVNAEPNTSPNFASSYFPELKAWRYAYNDNGELVGTSDARGCGENLVYDALGRLVSEDYSPCADGQAKYSPPDLTTGEGVEAFYAYDDDGRVTSTYDRGQHTEVTFDARGRSQTMSRQISITDELQPESKPFTTRYAPHTFVKSVTLYDEANRVRAETTGAESAELAPPGIGSSVTTAYNVRGIVTSVGSTYGALLASQRVDASGNVTQQVLGDAAGTTLDFGYGDRDGRLSDVHIYRGAGPWVNNNANYTPPVQGDPNNTLQGELAKLVYTYDGVGNPTDITDATDAAAWPEGAKPIKGRHFRYDDAYRLRSATFDYGATPDKFVSPTLAEEQLGSTRFPPVTHPTNNARIQLQKYDFDWLGNISTSKDDQGLFFDRSIGAVTNGAGMGPHQMSSSVGADGSTTSLAYDEAGNLVSLTVNRAQPCTSGCFFGFGYYWDEVGRLSVAYRLDENGPQVVLAHRYDASGSRVTKGRYTAQSSAPVYQVNVFDSLRLEGATIDANGDYEHTARTESLTLPGARVVYGAANLPNASSGRVYVLLNVGDHLGSSSFIIDHDTSELVERATYQTFGGTESDYRPDRWGNFRESVRYTSHDDDAEVGLTYFGQRYYAPAIGRFVSPDPLNIHELASDPNPYAFVYGSPQRYVDPFGLDPCSGDSSCGPLVGLGGGVGWAAVVLTWVFGGGGGGANGGGGGGNPQRGGTVAPTPAATSVKPPPIFTSGPTPTPREPSDPPGVRYFQAAPDQEPDAWARDRTPESEKVAARYPGLAARMRGEERARKFLELAPIVVFSLISKARAPTGLYIPRTATGKLIPLPQQRVSGQNIPTPIADGPHTVLGGRVGTDGVVYRQSATFPTESSWPSAGGQNVPWGRVDWSNHGRPWDHTNPHVHPLIYDWDQRQWITGPRIPFFWTQ